MVAVRFKLMSWIAVLGPGLLVMLADTDAGSLIISAQSGAVWGYQLLLQQILLIPVLFIVQELAVRLGLTTGLGQTELIKRHFGNTLAWVIMMTLVICCIGALLTELSGLAAVGYLFGLATWETMILVVAFLIVIAWTGSYASVERVAIGLGIFELVFVIAAIQAKPVMAEVKQGMLTIPWHNTSYLYLMAGNIGAVIMPWMIFFHQSAVLDKGLTERHLKAARWDTAIGAVITQIVMISALIMAAATLGKSNPHAPLNTVVEISHAITPLLGYTTGRILFALGMAGAALVATIVVSLTVAWGLGELLGVHHSLEHHPKEAPWFYGSYTLILLLSAAIIASDKINLVKLSVAIEVMNAFLLPLVLVFLYLLAWHKLPDPQRLKGWYAGMVAIVFASTSILAIVGGIIGSFS